MERPAGPHRSQRECAGRRRPARHSPSVEQPGAAVRQKRQRRLTAPLKPVEVLPLAEPAAAAAGDALLPAPGLAPTAPDLPPAAAAPQPQQQQQEEEEEAAAQPLPEEQQGVAAGNPYLELWAEYLAPAHQAFFLQALGSMPQDFQTIVRTCHPRDIFRQWPQWPAGVGCLFSGEAIDPQQLLPHLMLPPQLIEPLRHLGVQPCPAEVQPSTAGPEPKAPSPGKAIPRRDPVRRNLYGCFADS